MTKIITSHQGFERYNALLEDCVLQIQEYTNGKTVELSMTDEANNDLTGVDDNCVYFGEDFYSIQELSIFDALNILQILEGDLDA